MLPGELIRTDNIPTLRLPSSEADSGGIQYALGRIEKFNLRRFSRRIQDQVCHQGRGLYRDYKGNAGANRTQDRLSADTTLPPGRTCRRSLQVLPSVVERYLRELASVLHRDTDRSRHILSALIGEVTPRPQDGGLMAEIGGPSVACWDSVVVTLVPGARFRRATHRGRRPRRGVVASGEPPSRRSPASRPPHDAGDRPEKRTGAVPPARAPATSATATRRRRCSRISARGPIATRSTSRRSTTGTTGSHPPSPGA